MRARSALFTLFGDVVRPAGGEAWLTTLTACMRSLGFSPEATRTTLHRMAAEGWVAPRRVGRFSAYRLTTKGVERLDEAAERIYRLRAAPWDGHWHLVVCPRAAVDVDLARKLQWSGHGRLTGDLWVSPHPHGSRLDQLLAAHDAGAGTLRFRRADVADPAENARVVAAAWDLSELRDAHAAFLRAWGHEQPAAEPAAAFVQRIRLVHHWRSFLFLDPGLPEAVLPADWLADRAAGAFKALYEAVESPAWRYYNGLADGAPALQSSDLIRKESA